MSTARTYTIQVFIHPSIGSSPTTTSMSDARSCDSYTRHASYPIELPASEPEQPCRATQISTHATASHPARKSFTHFVPKQLHPTLYIPLPGPHQFLHFPKEKQQSYCFLFMLACLHSQLCGRILASLYPKSKETNKAQKFYNHIQYSQY